MSPEHLNKRLQEVKIKQLQSSNKSGLMPSYGQIAKNVGSSLVKNTISVIQGNDLKISNEEASDYTSNYRTIGRQNGTIAFKEELYNFCLLYTSDAADE
mgnify:CR=1 FL=1